MRLRAINIALTNSAVQLPNRECTLGELFADPENSGIVTVTEVEDDALVVTKLVAGAGVRLDMRKSPKGNLNEVKVKSTVASGDVLIIRPIVKVEEGGT